MAIKNNKNNCKKCKKIIDFLRLMLYYRTCASSSCGQKLPKIEPAQTARYAMKREVAAFEAGFSVEYVRFQTGRRNTVCREWLYGAVRLPNGCAASKTCDLQPIYAYRKLKPVRSLPVQTPVFSWGGRKHPAPCAVLATRQDKIN